LDVAMLSRRFPGNPAFLKRFSDFIRQQNADPLAAESVYAARGYDAMTAMMQAYAAAQPPRDGPAIIATLQRQNFTGMLSACGTNGSGVVELVCGC
jgi:ABC-type branched-subunit amino acid transport system substrate-binding protein